MARISVNSKKPRKPGSDLWTTDGTDVIIGKDFALQNEIDEVKAKTQARACFKECRTCGCCANSRRDATYPYSMDNGKKINCRTCEPFRFHDCHNGWMRDSHQDAEPFTEEAQKLFAVGGKPLI